MLEKNIIREKLINDSDCRESQVESIVEKILNMSPDIYAALEEWFNTGVIKEIEVEGYTVTSLRNKKKSMNIVGAYLTLDWLKREPQKAKFALNQSEFVNSAVTKKSMK